MVQRISLALRKFEIPSEEGAGSSFSYLPSQHKSFQLTMAGHDQLVDVLCVSESDSSKTSTGVRNRSFFPPLGAAQGVFLTSNTQTSFSGTWSPSGQENTTSSEVSLEI